MSDDGKRYMMVVEDSDVDFDIFRSVVNQHVLCRPIERTSSGEEALKALDEKLSKNQNLPSLLILDLNLLGISGIDVVRKIRADGRLKAIPAIILSTSSNQVDSYSSYEAGANTYLAKPIAYSDFEELIDLLMRYWFSAAHLPGNSLPSRRIGNVEKTFA